MLLQAVAGVHSDADPVDWENSWMAGDRDDDQLCAAAGIINQYGLLKAWEGLRF